MFIQNLRFIPCLFGVDNESCEEKARDDTCQCSHIHNVCPHWWVVDLVSSSSCRLFEWYHKVCVSWGVVTIPVRKPNLPIFYHCLNIYCVDNLSYRLPSEGFVYFTSAIIIFFNPLCLEYPIIVLRKWTCIIHLTVTLILYLSNNPYHLEVTWISARYPPLMGRSLWGGDVNRQSL